MEMRYLGATGMQVSSLCLGTMMFGPIGNNDADDCVRIIHRALDGGINFADTADVYSCGVSEEIVGKALEGRREHVVLATKFFNPMGDEPNQRGGSRRWIVKAVEDSLRRLRTIISISIRCIASTARPIWTRRCSPSPTSSGRARSAASAPPASPADRIVEAQWIADRRGHLRFRCEQSNYSLFNREIERFVLAACQRHGMGMIVWSPLDGGWVARSPFHVRARRKRLRPTGMRR